MDSANLACSAVVDNSHTGRGSTVICRPQHFGGESFESASTFRLPQFSQVKVFELFMASSFLRVNRALHSLLIKPRISNMHAFACIFAEGERLLLCIPAFQHPALPD
jgi:hypothetical protein